MKKTILIAAFVTALVATTNAQRQNERRDYNRDEKNRQDDAQNDNNRDERNRKDYDNRNEKNRDKNYRDDYARRDDNDRRGNNRSYENKNNNRNGRVEIYSRGNSYGNRNYGINDRYTHNWDFDYAPRDWNRDARFKIKDGERRGLITNAESRRLRRELERVEQCEYAYGSNGYFSRREREKLIDDIRDLNREISRQTRDNDYASHNGWYFRNGY